MGLDINVMTDNYEDIFSSDEYTTNDSFFYLHSLSRTFCNLMNREDAVSGEPELKQVGKLIDVDVTPIYDMNSYTSDLDDELPPFFFVTGNKEEKEYLMKYALENNRKLEGNLDPVLSTVNALLSKLPAVTNLSEQLTDNDFDTLNNIFYFADFSGDTGDGYIGNNFGQDLRNFKRVVEYAKEKGATMVYFNYG